MLHVEQPETRAVMREQKHTKGMKNSDAMSNLLGEAAFSWLRRNKSAGFSARSIARLISAT